MVALVRAKLPATSLVVPLLLAELLVAELAGRFPFLDQRTSQFFLVLVTVLAALVLTLGAGFAPAASKAAHKPIPNENVRGQVELVRAERRFGDVVIVSSGAAHAFGYYWPSPPTFVDRPTFGTVTFQVEYPDLTDVVIARDRDRAGVVEALARVPNGARRVWIIVGHELRSNWLRVAKDVGHVVNPPGDSCRAFSRKVLKAAGVSRGQCPLLVEPRRGGRADLTRAHWTRSDARSRGAP